MATISKKQREKVQADRRRLIAEALGEGRDDAGIRDRLIASGLSELQASHELQQAQKDPMFSAARAVSHRLANRVSKRDWTLDIYARLARHNPDDLTIPEIDAIEPERFFREFYFANRPVKLTGLVDHWPALKKWTLDYLESRLGDAVVEVQGDRGKATSYEIDKDPHRRHAPLREIIALLRRDKPSNDFYITAYNDTTNKQALAPLWEDLGPVSILQPSGGLDGFFWMGSAGTLTPFHHDLTNNLLVQVEGRKHVRMVPSWEVARMRNAVHCFSEREPSDFESDSEDLPPMLECTICKGEAIFLPIGWWHHVTALDRSISMSFTNFAADNQFTGGYPEDARF
ncbi:cupin-like domain-containing protein [Alteriqipengyuania sp.]|uniref:cupin-like domain-containing protein n=1 Tax=Alteriqipengyuania sp. TaxID=2800692 RepID=UPI003511C737